jgi:pilus assembly protein Flp/PilA
MTSAISSIRSFVRNEEGATMAEYALLVALIAVVVIVGAKALGNSVNTRMSNVADNVASP